MRLSLLGTSVTYIQEVNSKITSLLKFFLKTLTINIINGMKKMANNKYIVEMQVSVTEFYKIESDVALTEHEALFRAVSRNKPDEVDTGTGETPYEVIVIKGKLEKEPSLD